MKISRTLPRKASRTDETKNRAGGREGASAAAQRLRVLVVDDNDTVRELAVEILKTRGHSVAEAANGRAALAEFERTEPDVVLLDQEMPEMDGLEAARAIRRKESEAGARRTLLVGLSGNASAEDQRRAREAGMDALLSKPFDRKMLFELIEAPAKSGAGGKKSFGPAPAQTAALATHLKEMTRGNNKLARKLAAGFLGDLPAKLEAIERAIARKDAEGLASASHALQGSLGILNAQKALVAARNLEVLGRKGNLQNAAKELRDLAADLGRLERELRVLFPDMEPGKKKSVRS